MKVVRLIQEAIALDKKKRYSDSLIKYKEGIKLVEAFIAAETDVHKKFVFSLKLKEYQRWANVLSDYLKNSQHQPNDACQPLPLQENHFEMLCELSAVTPSLSTALDIGSTGELYLVEGKKSLALEKLTTALEMLIPTLSNEPVGPRKEMLHLQVIV